MKLRKISEITATLPFTELDFMQKYRESFAVSELGRIYAQLPLKELAEKIGSHSPETHPQGNTPMFSPEGEVALMFLKSYTGQSDDGLIEMLGWQHPHADVLRGARRSIRNFIGQVGEKANVICDRIASELVKSPVAGADESGFYVNGKLHWAWILQNPRLTLTWIAKGRGAKEVDERSGENALENTVLTTDRHSAYFSMNVKRHQICIAHLLRNLNWLGELGKKQDWSSRLREPLRKAVHWRNENPEAVAGISTWMESLDKLLNENLDKLKKPFRQIRNSLRKLREHVFHFLKDPRVPSHNNASEGGIRILKVKQKRSGGFRSQTGAEDFMAIHSVSDTAKKNNFSRWEAVLALV